MSTPPVPPVRPDDEDPTGIRALLSRLPEPGPMPAHLVDRINASIAAEQQARAAAGDGKVLPLRRRGASWLRVALVAAAVAVVAVAVPTVLGSGPGAVMASLTGGDAAQQSSAGSAAGSARAPAPPVESFTGPAPSAGDRAASPRGATTMRSTGTAYRTATLAAQAQGAGDRPASGAGTERHLGPADTEGGLRACLTALGVPAWMPVNGDRATLDGRPAVVALAHGDTDVTVWVVAPACDGEHLLRLAGPVPLG